MGVGRYLPFVDLRELSSRELGADLTAGAAVAFLAVPQAVAYAMIAGLPPAAGLFAAGVPAIVGGLFRSSRHVVTGPTNAVSLLVGATVIGTALGDPVAVAITLALLVGLLQLGAGLLRLGVLVDYISRPVVLGYVTGAGVLIFAGQLPNVTGTVGGEGHLFGQLWGWVGGIGAAEAASVGVALGTASALLALRRIDRRIPGAIVVTVAGIALGYALDGPDQPLSLVRDLASVPVGFPPLTVPETGMVVPLLPAAVACAVLSLVEATAVARTLARKTGQRLDIDAELSGQGLANVAAAFTGGYPTSGSLGRSAVAVRAGAKSRLTSIVSGVLVIATLLFLGPIVDHTPVASLAGLLLVIAVDLVDVKAIRLVWSANPVDRFAFLGTLVGTWLLPLDQAIYVGVGISLVLFLRRARLLVVQEMLVIEEDGRLSEVDPGADEEGGRRCAAIRILQLEGALFFGASGELAAAIDRMLDDDDVRILVVRTKRTIAMDVTTASILADTADRMRAREGALLMVGTSDRDMHLLRDTGLAERIDEVHLFPSEPGIFVAMERALARALELAGDHACETCPIAARTPEDE